MTKQKITYCGQEYPAGMKPRPVNPSNFGSRNVLRCNNCSQWFHVPSSVTEAGCQYCDNGVAYLES